MSPHTLYLPQKLLRSSDYYAILARLVIAKNQSLLTLIGGVKRKIEEHTKLQIQEKKNYSEHQMHTSIRPGQGAINL
jgi:hypothetical protein